MVGEVMTAVVKLQTYIFASLLPDKSLAPVVIMHVYVRFGSKPFGTTKTAVVSVYETTPKIGELPCRTINDEAVIEFGSIGVLNVAEITLTVATLADP